MADYTRGTGSGGIMLIRDLGIQIQFHIQAGQSATFVGSLNWNGFVNGVNVSGAQQYPSGRPWVHLASYDCYYNQSVRFSIAATGTQGLGGPTDFWLAISRSTIPPPPTAPNLALGHIDGTITFSSQGDGGAGVDLWELHYGRNPNAGEIGVYSSGTTYVQNLKQGEWYYAWARGHNANGWSAWSGRGQARTIPGAWVKVDGVWKEAVPMVKVGGVWKDAIPYVKKNGAWESGR